MRVMVSPPMEGLTAQQVEQNRARAVKRLEAEGHEAYYVLLIGDPPIEDRDVLWLLGRTLQQMSVCDAVLFLEGWQDTHGCRIARAACEAYGLKVMEE